MYLLMLCRCVYPSKTHYHFIRMISTRTFYLANWFVFLFLFVCFLGFFWGFFLLSCEVLCLHCTV